MGSIAAMQAAARAIDSANTGYDQYQRWSFFNRSTNQIIRNAEGDCSSVCGAIARLGGYPVNLDDPFYTGTFRQRLTAAGFTAIPYSGLSQIRPGDFLLNSSNHVEFVYSRSTLFSANKDEAGDYYGGRAGDQTGVEVYFKPAYVYWDGWDWILRPPTDSETTAQAPAGPVRVDEDGYWGPATTKALQEINGTPIDGIVSSQDIAWQSQNPGLADGWEWTDDPVGSQLIEALQRAWGADPDGLIGPSTIRAMQAYYGTTIDGVLDEESPAIIAMQHAINTQLEK